MCGVQGKALKFIRRARKFRRVSLFFVQKRAELRTHIGNQICILNNNFKRLVTAEILKLRKHVFRCSEIKRRLNRCVFEILRAHQYCAENRILRFDKMNVSRCNNGFVQFFAECNNTAVEIAKLFIILCKPLAHKEGIVSDRLNFKVIVP